jgi:sirohydrochlorin cobaltochelatase
LSSAIILFAHGSRDPLWRAPIEAVAARIRAASASALVQCAYLELTEPDLPTAVAQLLADGAESVAIVPMFLGMGRHAREDLPALVTRLRQDHPETVFTLRPAVGEDARVIEMLAHIAAE